MQRLLAIALILFSVNALSQDSGGGSDSGSDTGAPSGEAPYSGGGSTGGMSSGDASSADSAAICSAAGVSADTLGAMGQVAESVQGQVTALGDAFDAMVDSGLVSEDALGFLAALQMDKSPTVVAETEAAYDAIINDIISRFNNNELTPAQLAAWSQLTEAGKNTIIALNNALNARGLTAESMSNVLATILTPPPITGEPGVFPGRPAIDTGGTGLATQLILVDLDPQAIRPNNYVPTARTRYLGGALTLYRGQAISGNGTVMRLEQSGNLVIYDDQSQVLWSSKTAGKVSSTVTAFAKLQTSGVLGLYSRYTPAGSTTPVTQLYWSSNSSSAGPTPYLYLSAQQPHLTITNSSNQQFYNSGKVAYLRPNELSLEPGQQLVTPRFRLVYGTDAKLTLIAKMGISVFGVPLESTVWSVGGQYCYIPGQCYPVYCKSVSCKAVFGSDGNLSLYYNGTRYWTTQLGASSGRKLRIAGQYPYMGIVNSSNGAFAWWPKP